jgi:hypothetical protein
METKHTQGEWVVSEFHETNEHGSKMINIDAGSYLSIISIYYSDERKDKEEAEANAKLIANAPDMLSVLREAVDHAHVYDTNPALVELFEAVIQKATN